MTVPPTSKKPTYRVLGAFVAVMVGLCLFPAGCKKKVSQAQCDELVDKFATLVVKERIKDASPETIKAEQERERGEAKNDDSFRNCTSEVSDADFACAMATLTSEAFLKCLD
jgi:hypothetical protein